MGFFLEHISKEFPLPPKVYGLCDDFIARVIRTWNNTTTNLGALLNGIRGTGKTVTCEILANKLQLPVIIVDAAYDDINEFVGNIQQDVVLFFDEFEKVFPREYGHPSKLLMLMDGVTKGAYRKLFLLTTNELNIEPNMIQRPGRIRYVKTFGNLHPDIIYQIVDDRLKYTELRQSVIDFVSELELITVDSVCAIIDEVNIHHEAPSAFEDVFNVKKIADLHAVYEVIKDENGTPIGEKLLHDNIKLRPAPLNYGCVGYDLWANRDELGQIAEVLDTDLINIYSAFTEKEIIDAEENDTELDICKQPIRTLRIEPRSSYNRVFRGGGNRFMGNGLSCMDLDI